MARTAFLIGALALISTTAAQAAPPACRKLTVAAYPNTKNTPLPMGRVPRFSAAQVADLELGIIVGPGPQVEVELFQIRLFTPAGHLYQAIDVPVGLPGKQEEGARVLRGYPFPVTVAKRQAAIAEGAGAEQVSARLPLGGSLVSAASLYGRWRAEARSDTDPSPCASVVFEVTP